MQNKYYTHDEFQSLILDKRPPGAEINDIVNTYVSNGYTIEGVNEPVKEPNIAQTIVGGLLEPASRLGQTVGAGTIAGYKTLTEGGNLGENYQEASKLYEQSGKTLGGTLFGKAIEPATSVEQLAGDVIQTGALLVPGTSILGGAATGGAILGGQAMSEEKSLEDVSKMTALGAAGGGLISGAIVGAEKFAGPTAKLVSKAAGNIKPVVTGTGEVIKAAGRTLKSIPENVAVNVGELQAKEAAIKAIASKAGQNAVRKGVDIADATTLQKAIQTPEAKNLIQTIKNYAAGDKAVSPFEIVGKPIVNRLKTLDTQVKDFAKQLDSVAQDLKGISVGDVSNIDKSVIEGLKKLQVSIKKGGLDFSGSSLEGVGNSGKIVENVFKRLQTAADAFDLHNLKKYIDSNVSYGKRVEGLDAGAERLLKTWRKAIDDTLDTQFIDYNKVNTELAKRISPLEDLKGILKNADGLDDDLLSQKAGIIARRITSAAASNPEIKQILRNLDSFTSGKGKTLGKIENLQDLYNVLNKYYDIAPKTGFQNLVKEGVNSPIGIVDQATEAVKDFAGTTNAVRQKALEDYLTELLTKTSKTKK